MSLDLLPGLPFKGSKGHVAVATFEDETRYQFRAGTKIVEGTSIRDDEFVSQVKRAYIIVFVLGVVTGAFFWFTVGRASGRKAARKEIRRIVTEVRNEKIA